MGTRLEHSRGVAHAARRLAPVVGNHADLLEASGWLHDIGYAPDLATTGFHPLDGARHLRALPLGDPLLWELVARHTQAHVEAGRRGLLGELDREFPGRLTSERLLACLTYADMVTGPDGTRVTPESRITEILNRYDAGSVVHDSIKEAAPALLGMCSRVETWSATSAAS